MNRTGSEHAHWTQNRGKSKRITEKNYIMRSYTSHQIVIKYLKGRDHS
jgi:hypothetical protein